MRNSDNDFPYVLIIPKIKNQWEADKWCTEKFGKKWSVVDNREGVWRCFWRGFKSPGPGNYEWSFKNEQDAVLFALTWQ